MPGQTAEYLADFPLFRTHDLDEARHRVTEKFCDHTLHKSSRTDQLAVRHNHVSGKNVSINYLHYGAQVAIDPGMLGDFYLLQVPLSGSAFVRHRGYEIEANATRASLLNPDRETEMIWQGGCRKLLLQIDKEYLHRVAEIMLGRPAPGTIRFDPAVDLRPTPGQYIRRVLKQSARMAEVGALFGRGATSQDQWTETELVSSLLIHQASNISHMLHNADHRARPAQIRRALAYMHGNLSEPIRLADIAASAGMNVRTLQKGFQREFGKSPMQVLRETRLDTAHFLLSGRRDAETVTDAAYQVGFSHLGRFSQAYRMRFGQLPSDTVSSR